MKILLLLLLCSSANGFFYKALSCAYKAVSSGVKRGFEVVVGTYKSVANHIIPKAVNFVQKGVQKGVKKVAEAAVKVAESAVVDVVLPLTRFVADVVVDQVPTFLTDAHDTIKDVLQDVGSSVANSLDEACEWMIDTVHEAVDNVTNTWLEVLESGARPVVKMIQDAHATVTKGIRDNIGKVVNTLEKTISSILSGDPIEALQNLEEGLGDPFGFLKLSEVVKMGRDGLKRIRDFVFKQGERVINAVEFVGTLYLEGVKTSIFLAGEGLAFVFNEFGEVIPGLRPITNFGAYAAKELADWFGKTVGEIGETIIASVSNWLRRKWDDFLRGKFVENLPKYLGELATGLVVDLAVEVGMDLACLAMKKAFPGLEDRFDEILGDVVPDFLAPFVPILLSAVDMGLDFTSSKAKEIMFNKTLPHVKRLFPQSYKKKTDLLARFNDMAQYADGLIGRSMSHVQGSLVFFRWTEVPVLTSKFDITSKVDNSSLITF